MWNNNQATLKREASAYRPMLYKNHLATLFLRYKEQELLISNMSLNIKTNTCEIHYKKSQMYEIPGILVQMPFAMIAEIRK